MANIDGLVRDAIAKLRLKLLDLSNRNRLLNFKFTDSSRKFVRVIDELPRLLYERLTGESGSNGKMYFAALPEPWRHGEYFQFEDLKLEPLSELSHEDLRKMLQKELSASKDRQSRPRGRAAERGATR